MELMLRSATELPDASQGRGHKVVVDAGTYPLVEVPNPYGFATPWLMIKGTQIGAAKTWLLFAIDERKLPGELRLNN